MNRLLFSLLLLSLDGGSVLAESKPLSPVQELTEIVTRIKATKDPGVILDYVHWDSAFNNLPVSEREAMGVNSANELKEHFAKASREPGSALRRQMLARIKNASGESKERMNESVERMVRSLEEQKARMQSRIADTEYKIGQVEQNGDGAVVELIASLEGETKISRVRFEKIGQHWYLPSIRFVQDQDRTDQPAGSQQPPSQHQAILPHVE